MSHVPDEARDIRREISRMEHCHESFRANAAGRCDDDRVLGPRSCGHACVLDCGDVGDQRQVTVSRATYAALRRWRDRATGTGALDQTVEALCGARDARKLDLSRSSHQKAQGQRLHAWPRRLGTHRTAHQPSGAMLRALGAQSACDLEGDRHRHPDIRVPRRRRLVLVRRRPGPRHRTRRPIASISIPGSMAARARTLASERPSRPGS